jgi:uncharacterized protein YndB with AHSA1/START domain
MAEEAAFRGQGKVHVDAPAQKVYEMVSDITRMGEWSPEAYKGEWTEGSTGPAVGAQFRGYNKQGWMKWSRPATVRVADPGKEFTFETGKPGKEETRWTYRFTPSGTGTDVSEEFQALRYGFLAKLIARPEKRSAKLTGDVEQTLQRIKTAAEGRAAS